MKVAIYFCAVILLTVPVLADSVEEWAKTENAAAAASKAGRFQEAEQLLQQNEKFARTFPLKDARRPRTLLDLAHVYRAEGKYSEALARYERAQQLYTELYGSQSGELAEALNGEGELYKNLGDYEKAEPALEKALAMREKLPPEEANVAQSKNDLGEVYSALGQYDKAEPLLQDALNLRKSKTPESTEVGQTLIALGIVYEKTSRSGQAEDAYRQSASMLGKTLGGDHPDYANAIEHLALVCEARKDFDIAEPLLERVLEIRKKAYGPEHRDVATSLEDLAGLKRAENRPREAADLYEQSLAMLEKIVGSDSPDLAPDLNNLAAIYEITAGKQQRAEQLFVRAVALDEKALGSDSPDLATDLNNLGLLYLFTKRYQLAADTLGRALAIRRKAFGDSDPLVKESAGPYNTAVQALHQKLAN